MSDDKTASGPQDEAKAQARNYIEETRAHTPKQLEDANALLVAALDSLTPAIVQRLAATTAQLGELVDTVNTDETRSLVAGVAQTAESLERSLDIIKQLEESGTLETLAELGSLANAVRQSITSPLVSRPLSAGVSLALTGGQFLDAAQEAASEARRDTRRITIFGLLGELRDPQIQDSLKFILALARRLPGILNTEQT
ncbi:MAG TPA: DUF1641 domain-containing protein [Candidatus Aquicultor sp.]|jgi:uncharacterized protein YjgD (DUF1641 family)